MSEAESYTEEAEHEEVVVEKNLEMGDMPACLSLLCKIDSGLAHAYVKISAKSLKLTNIELLKKYVHLRYVDISNNSISDFSSLNNLRSLLWLKANNNKAKSAQLDEFPYLQVIDFSFNEIESVEGIAHPLLEHLNLNDNKLTTVTNFNPNLLPSLMTLQIRSNHLTSTAGIINFPNLKHLFLASNEITSLEGINTLDNLEILHLRNNSLTTFENHFQENKNTKLKYINFRANSINSFEEVKKLSVLNSLECISLLENPLVEEQDYRIDVLVNVRKLIKLDKDPFDDEEVETAQDKYEAMMQEIRDAEKEAEGSGEVEDEE